MISEGSCNTGDWSNDAENSALHHRNKLCFIVYCYVPERNVCLCIMFGE